MLRPLAERTDGYRLLEIGSIDDLDLAAFLPMLDRAWRADYAGEPRLDFDEAVLRKLARLVLGRCRRRWPDGSPVGFELALERASCRWKPFAVFTRPSSRCGRSAPPGPGPLLLEGINRLVFEQRGGDLILSPSTKGTPAPPPCSPRSTSFPAGVSSGSIAARSGAGGWTAVPCQRSSACPPTSSSRGGGRRRRDRRRARAAFAASFALSASLAAQYLNPSQRASGMILFEPGAGGRGLVGWNVLPMAIDDRRLRPIGQLQLLLADDRCRRRWCTTRRTASPSAAASP